jgi:hypothetical protein
MISGGKSTAAVEEELSVVHLADSFNVGSTSECRAFLDQSMPFPAIRCHGPDMESYLSRDSVGLGSTDADQFAFRFVYISLDPERDQPWIRMSLRIKCTVQFSIGVFTASPGRQWTPGLKGVFGIRPLHGDV